MDDGGEEGHDCAGKHGRASVVGVEEGGGHLVEAPCQVGASIRDAVDAAKQGEAGGGQKRRGSEGKEGGGERVLGKLPRGAEGGVEEKRVSEVLEATGELNVGVAVCRTRARHSVSGSTSREQ